MLRNAIVRQHSVISPEQLPYWRIRAFPKSSGVAKLMAAANLLSLLPNRKKKAIPQKINTRNSPTIIFNIYRMRRHIHHQFHSAHSTFKDHLEWKKNKKTVNSVCERYRLFLYFIQITLPQPHSLNSTFSNHFYNIKWKEVIEGLFSCHSILSA